MALRVKTHKDIKQIIASAKALSENKVMVGVPSTEVGRKDGPASNAVIAYIHEHGSPRQNIPPRPFLEPGVRNAEEAIVARLKHAADLAMAGNKQGVIKALHGLGLVAQAAVRKKITDGPFIPLSPVTLAARAARGVKRTKPLLDTGALRQSINYVLRGKWF